MVLHSTSVLMDQCNHDLIRAHQLARSRETCATVDSTLATKDTPSDAQETMSTTAHDNIVVASILGVERDCRFKFIRLEYIHFKLVYNSAFGDTTVRSGIDMCCRA